MATFKSAYATGVKKMPTPAGSEVVSVRMVVALTTAAAGNDMVQFGELPEDCIPVDWMLDYDDLGSESSRLDLQEAKRNSVASMRRTAAKYRGSLEDDAENA